MPVTAQQGTPLHPLLGEPASSAVLSSFLASLRTTSSSSSPSDANEPEPEPHVKLYSDTLFHNHPSLGLSLSFSPPPSFPSSVNLKTAPPSVLASLPLSGVDIYNHATSPLPSSQRSSSSSKPKDPTCAPFPAYPILLPSLSPSAAPFPLTPETTGAQLVRALGEPARKGGGGIGMGVWTEWTFPAAGDKKQEKQEQQGARVAVMVEWASSGLGAWEKGGESGWRVVSVYRVEGEKKG
ncbi:hypothetical protein JCM6882_006983 [Rhodosporidiobolus microsporus]